MTTLYLDIETLPAAWSDAEIDAHALASVPGNYSKLDTIAKWIAENRLEVHARTALDWRHARILAIGYALDDAPATTLYNGQGSDEGLLAMFDALSGVVARAGALEGLVIVGHNAIGSSTVAPKARCSAVAQSMPLPDAIASARAFKMRNSFGFSVI